MKNTYLLVLILAIISCENTKKIEIMSLFNVNKEFFGKTTDVGGKNKIKLKCQFFFSRRGQFHLIGRLVAHRIY